MRIAFIADPESPNGWYRGIGPMVALGARGHEVRQVELRYGELRSERVRGCDVLHVHRRQDEDVLRLVHSTKEAGIAVVWDNDDDETALPKSHPLYKHYGGAAGVRVKAAVQRIVRLADLVTTPSGVLAERFRDVGAAQVRVIENYVRDELLRVRPRPHAGEVVVGWLAGTEHYLDVERVPIRHELGCLLDAHRHVRVVSIGLGLGLGGERYEHIGRLPLDQLPQHMATFDIGLAVLADIPFNRARSNVKLKEYAALGIPWLASPTGPYADMGERQGGRLVSDDGWYDALERLVLNARERRKLAKRAAKWGRGQTIAANAGAWEDALRCVIASTQGSGPS